MGVQQGSAGISIAAALLCRARTVTHRRQSAQVQAEIMRLTAVRAGPGMNVSFEPIHMKAPFVRFRTLIRTFIP